MRQVSRVNYLHYGDALQRLSSAELPSPHCVTKQELLSSIENGCCPSSFLHAIVTDYAGCRSRRLELADLASDLRHSEQMQEVFRALRCRGFSYKLFADMTGFPYRLRKRVNLRMALVADRDLFYPPNVRRYLARHSANHYFVYEAPAIAFALGMATRHAWYVFVMQSDVVRRGPACIREHFRGWRKVLFANIIEHARDAAHRVYLCREEDVLEACHGDHPRPSSPPASWRSIYRGTASDFGMLTIELTRRINIQLYSRRRPIYAEIMYCLDIENRASMLTRPYNGAAI